MSTERQMRFHLDIARAHAQRRQINQAIEALTIAEAIELDTFRSHPVALQVVEDITPLATGAAKETVAGITHRIGSRT